MNTHVRDNFSETAPAKVTTAGDIVYATASNTLTRLAIGSAGALLGTNVAGTAPRWTSTTITASGGGANNAIVAGTLTANANSDSLYQFFIQGVFATTTRTGLTAAGLVISGAGMTETGSGTIANAYAAYIDAPTIGTNNWALYVADGNVRLGDGVAYINDTANSFMTTGLTIKSSVGGEMVSLKVPVAHGMTTLAETDTAGVFAAYDSTLGGASVTGYTTGPAGNNAAVIIAGNATNDDTTKSTAGMGDIHIYAGKKSGSSAGAIGANANILSVANLTTTRFILDGDGDSHQDVGTAWTNFDSHNDADLLTALSVYVSKTGDPIKREFGKFLKTNRSELESLKLVTFNADGHHFVNMSRLTMLLVGAVRQAANQISVITERLATIENKLLLSGA